MKKKVIAILLSLSMIIGIMPTLAFATSGETTPVTETTAPTESTPSVCSVCQTENCTVEHKQCEICKAYDCAKTHVFCETCQKYDCGVDHSAIPAGEPAKCETCGEVLSEGHICPTDPVCSCSVLCKADAPKSDCPVCSTEGGVCTGSGKYVEVQAMIDALRTEYKESEREAALAEYEAATKAITELSEEEFALLDLTNYYAAANPTVLPAEGAEFDFSNVDGDKSGEGWSWSNSSKTLTLSGAAITEQVILPADSTVSVTADSSITPAYAAACISTSGTITIGGSGKLTLNALCGETYSNTIEGASDINISNVSLTTVGKHGLAARNISISNSKVDITGYSDGLNASKAGSAKIRLENVSGTIVGITLNGINLYITDSGAAASGTVDIIRCSDLTIRNNGTTVGYHIKFQYSAIRAYADGANCSTSVNISECRGLNFYGNRGGISTCCSANNSTGDAIVNIENSDVRIKTLTNAWAAIFANNSGDTDGDALINIRSSTVNALCPNDVAIMTSSDYGNSAVSISDSDVELCGKYAGIRVKCNANRDVAAIDIDNSFLLTSDDISQNYFALDVIKDGKSSDGSADALDERSTLIVPVPGSGTKITANSDGTWSIPENGEIYFNNEKRIYLNGATVNADSTINGVPYAVFAYNVVTVGGGSGGTLDKSEEAMTCLYENAKGVCVTVNSGYLFKGWFTDEACTQKVTASWVDADNKLTPQKNSEGLYESGSYYALFEEMTTTVTYKVAYTGTGSVCFENAAAAETITDTFGKVTGSPKTATAKPANGYMFVGWYTDEACTKLHSKQAAMNSSENGTFYAKFIKDHATVTIEKTVDKASSSDQSFILNISGTTYNNDPVNVDVVIVIPAGQTSGSVKVVLPVSNGEYSISDQDGWNWRYKVKDNATITINGGDSDRVLSVTSTLENGKWFADSYIYPYKKES